VVFHQGSWLHGPLGLALSFGSLAHADPLSDIGATCVNGNPSACMIYQTAVQQQAAMAEQQQRAVDSTVGWLTQQQYLANQRMQFGSPQPTVCHQSGYFIVCQ
jgi:hypothetical protein